MASSSASSAVCAGATGAALAEALAAGTLGAVRTEGAGGTVAPEAEGLAEAEGEAEGRGVGECTSGADDNLRTASCSSLLYSSCLFSWSRCFARAFTLACRRWWPPKAIILATCARRERGLGERIDRVLLYLV